MLTPYLETILKISFYVTRIFGELGYYAFKIIELLVSNRLICSEFIWGVHSSLTYIENEGMYLIDSSGGMLNAVPFKTSINLLP